MKKVLLVGNYGVGNMGDDMLMESSIQQIVELGSMYTIACPGDIQDSVSIPAAGVRSFFSFRWLSFFKALKECDVVVFGGGGLLNPEEKMSLVIWGQIIAMAKLYKKDIVMIGQSFSKVDRVVDFLLDMVDSVSVRDTYSKKILDEYFEGGLVKVDDLAWSLKLHTNDNEFSNKICLNLRPYRYIDDKTLKIVVGNLIEEIEKVLSFDEIVLLGFGLEDVGFSKEILGIGIKKRFKISVANNLNDVCSAIVNSKLVIAERLHACITTMKLGRPLVSLSYSSKVFSMMSDYNVNSLINLRKEIDNLNYQDIIRDALVADYKKPHPGLDKVLKDVLSE